MCSESASCTHVSGLLHALVAMCPKQISLTTDLNTPEEPLPITSYACQWKQPRKRKESSLPVSETTFKKHTYGRQVKHTLKPLKDFDPRPVEYQGTAPQLLEEFLKKVQGKGLGISLLLDKDMQVCKDSCDKRDKHSACAYPNVPAVMPSPSELVERVELFKKSLQLTAQQIRELEMNTRDQTKSQLWYSARQYRLTASTFGRILQMLPTTPPDSLVKHLLHPKEFSTKATEWGRENEPMALEKYTEHQLQTGHTDLVTFQAGFVVCEHHPFIGASPDAYVLDPSTVDQFGLAEIKCPYKYRELTPADACKHSDFCCKLAVQSDGRINVELKRNHSYYSQIQGQLAITERKWCDFVIFTNKGISIERIQFDHAFWEDKLLPKLTNFYDNCLCPSIVSPVHLLGLKVHDLRVLPPQ